MKIKITKSPFDDRSIEIFLKMVAMQWVAYAIQMFKEQGDPSMQWKPRAVPQIAAILSKIDEHAGEPSPHMIDDFIAPSSNRPALIQTGTLQNSITYGKPAKSGGKWKVSVGSNLDYAELMHNGGFSEIRITNEMKRDIKSLLSSKNKGKFDFLAKFLHSDYFRTIIPPREYFKWGEKLNQYIGTIFSDWSKKLKGG